MHNMNNEQLCYQYLDILYQDARRTVQNYANKNSIPETYGEILYPSVQTLMTKIEMTGQDVFFDLGSGMGKVALQLFLLSNLKECYGIEIIPELHHIAVQAANKIQTDLTDFYSGERKLAFIQGSFLDVSFDRATIVMIGSPCFTPGMLAKVGTIIENTPGIHTVLTLRPITTLKRLRFIKTVRLECSWDSALCYIYGKHSRMKCDDIIYQHAGSEPAGNG